MQHPSAPGNTFKRHLAIARGLLSEDDYLISEILFNPLTAEKLDGIIARLTDLRDIVRRRDSQAMSEFLSSVRANFNSNTEKE